MFNSVKAFVALLIVCSIPCSGHTQDKTVAITIDDLPYASGDPPPGPLSATPKLAMQVNRKILAGLSLDHVPATGFVIEQGVRELGRKQGSLILKQWTGNGLDLGNHTYSHSGLNDLSITAFEDDVIKGEQTFLPLSKKAGRDHGLFLRFPYNQSGDTREKHDAIAAFLAQRGYRIAPCTIENEDYVFNAAYVQMLGHGKTREAARLRAAYLAYTSDEIDYYGRLNNQVLGYEPPQIMLLHDSKLNADVIALVLQLFIDKGYRFVSLAEAESDPVYSAPDTYVTKYGPMWGYRWAEERGVKVNGSLEKEPPEWITNYGK